MLLLAYSPDSDKLAGASKVHSDGFQKTLLNLPFSSRQCSCHVEWSPELPSTSAARAELLADTASNDNEPERPLSRACWLWLGRG
eukprot:1552519-Rhodomonas_salina.1